MVMTKGVLAVCITIAAFTAGFSQPSMAAEKLPPGLTKFFQECLDRPVYEMFFAITMDCRRLIRLNLAGSCMTCVTTQARL